MKKFFFGNLGILFLVVLISCTNGSGICGGNSVSVVSWNVQTFFDANNTGSEYSEFLKSKTWNEAMYVERVGRLCKVMAELNSDVYVFEEIENEAVIQDICNGLAEVKWDANGNWQYACFFKDENSSIGCGVISKYELKDFTNHCMDVRTNEKGQPGLRAIGKVTVNLKGKEFYLFVNHWKSKNTGEAETEIWRTKQEGILTNLVSECIEENQNCSVLICGDFNKSIQEFEYVPDNENGNILLRDAGFERKKEVLVYSPWYEQDGRISSKTGSYYYQDNWEYIDNFFVCGNFQVLDFEACSNDFWTRENGIPYSFKIYTGEGYSDHLPIKIVLQF